MATYPKLSAELPEEDRPKWQVVIERAADSEEQEPDPLDPGRQRAELLSVSLFVTAGTLESGRGSFLDLTCTSDCPQLIRSTLSWQPPAALAGTEAPDDRTHFVVVLRDAASSTPGRPALGAGEPSRSSAATPRAERAGENRDVATVGLGTVVGATDAGLVEAFGPSAGDPLLVSRSWLDALARGEAAVRRAACHPSTGRCSATAPWRRTRIAQGRS